jgi:hypothetical protein
MAEMARVESEEAKAKVLEIEDKLVKLIMPRYCQARSTPALTSFSLLYSYL